MNGLADNTSQAQESSNEQNESINSIIDSFFQEHQDTTKNAPPPEAQENISQEQAHSPEDEVIRNPKAILNAYDRTKAELREVKQEIAKYKKMVEMFESNQSQQAAQQITPDQFNSLEEYYDQRAKAQATQEATRLIDKKFQEMQMNEWRNSRIIEADKKAAEYAPTIGDFNRYYEEGAQSFAGLPRNVQDLLLGAEDGALALYVLTKNNALSSLANISEAQAAYAIRMAEEHGKKELQRETNAQPSQGRVSSAPSPIQTPKGTVQAPTKDIMKMTPEEAYQAIFNRKR